MINKDDYLNLIRLLAKVKYNLIVECQIYCDEHNKKLIEVVDLINELMVKIPLLYSKK